MPLCSAAGEDETSARFIAKQLAAEAGGHPDQYLRYSRELAAILVTMSPAEQKAVIGFSPPIAHSRKPSSRPRKRPDAARSGEGKLVPNTNASAWFGWKDKGGSE